MLGRTKTSFTGFGHIDHLHLDLEVWAFVHHYAGFALLWDLNFCHDAVFAVYLFGESVYEVIDREQEWKSSYKLSHNQLSVFFI